MIRLKDRKQEKKPAGKRVIEKKQRFVFTFSFKLPLVYYVNKYDNIVMDEKVIYKYRLKKYIDRNIEILRIAKEAKLTFQQIAKKYKVSPQLISKIVKRGY